MDLNWPPWRFSENFETRKNTLGCWKITHFAHGFTCFWPVKTKGLTWFYS
jgi:hypothetical protein